MNNGEKRIAGLGAVALLIGLGIAWAAMTAKVRSVKLTDQGAAMKGGATTDQRLDWPDMRIDVNSAAPAELALLPGLGPSLAERIVAYRSVNGPFKSLDELMKVKGIGEAIVERLRPFATADSQNVEADDVTD